MLHFHSYECDCGLVFSKFRLPIYSSKLVEKDAILFPKSFNDEHMDFQLSKQRNLNSKL